MWLVAEEDVFQVIEGVDIRKGERVLMEMSRKFTPEDIRQLAFQSNFYVQVREQSVSLFLGVQHEELSSGMEMLHPALLSLTCGCDMWI